MYVIVLQKTVILAGGERLVLNIVRKYTRKIVMTKKCLNRPHLHVHVDSMKNMISAYIRNFRRIIFLSFGIIIVFWNTGIIFADSIRTDAKEFNGRDGETHFRSEIIYRGDTPIMRILSTTKFGITRKTRSYLVDDDLIMIESDETGNGSFDTIVLFNPVKNGFEAFKRLPDNSVVPVDDKTLSIYKKQNAWINTFWDKTVDSTASYFTKGCAKYAKGDLDGALDDYNKSISSERGINYIDYANLYIWLILTQENKKSNADANLSIALKKNWSSHSGDWVSKIAKFFLNQINENDFIAAAASTDSKKNNQQYCEAWYYAGMKRLLEGDRKIAKDYFHKCISTNQKDYFEYSLAQAELRKLEKIK